MTWYVYNDCYYLLIGLRRPSNQSSMAANERFASVLSVIGEHGLLALSDLAASVATCKDTQAAAIGGLMHEYPVLSNGAPGFLKFLEGPFERCLTCNFQFTNLRWPMAPHKGLTICDLCICMKHDTLRCLTTMEARHKYRVKDLSKLQSRLHIPGRQ